MYFFRIFLLFSLFSSMASAMDKDRIIELAKADVSAALNNSYIEEAGLKEEYLKVQDLLEGKLSLTVKKCSGRFESYVAYVIPGSGKNNLRIQICKGFENLPDFSLAQTIIHEVSHLAGVLDEQQATRLESLAAFFSGRTPELNGYNTNEVIFQVIDDLSEEDLLKRNLDYFVLQGIRTKRALKISLLRTHVIYNRKSEFNQLLDQLCAKDLSCEKEILQTPDTFSVSVEDLKRDVGTSW